jgi:serine/threonine protein kinase
MYMMIANVPPFPGKNDKEIEERVARGKYSLTYGKLSKLSPQGKKFLTRLMEVKVDKRATAQQALDDPWLGKMI